MNDAVERKTITIPSDEFDALDAIRGDRTWAEFARDIIQNHSGDDAPGEVLTQEHIDDIANAAARRTADELEAIFR